MRGLREIGAEPVALNVAPPRRLERTAIAVISLAYLRPRKSLRAAIVRARAPPAARGRSPRCNRWAPGR